MKYLIISFDDGTYHDRRMVKLLDTYRLKGTFFLNSGTLNTDGHLEFDELRELFKRHEVASHTVGHPKLRELTKEGIKYQIEEDVSALKNYWDKEIVGFAYPFGDYTKKVKDMTKECGITYARTTKSSLSYARPKDLLEWHPTMHVSGISWGTDDDKKVEDGFKYLFNCFEEFMTDEDAELFHVWMHSWELGEDQEKWDRIERFFRFVNNEDDLNSVTYSEYVKVISK